MSSRGFEPHLILTFNFMLSCIATPWYSVHEPWRAPADVWRSSQKAGTTNLTKPVYTANVFESANRLKTAA